MNVNLFVTSFNVRPADAVVLNKKFLGMVDHYVIYLGFIAAKHQFVANYIGGVKIIPKEDIDQWLVDYMPSKVDHFPGPENKRGEALKRATSRIGEKSYNYIANNCEHFKNYVHHGIESSSQVTKAGVALALGGVGLTLIGADKKNNSMAWWGVILLLLGIVIASMGIKPVEKSKSTGNANRS